MSGASVLDVGCGLGYYTKAWADAGANVTGVDISEAGIELAKRSFPECNFSCAAWPDGIEQGQLFDIVWEVGLSLINTFNVQAIHDRFIKEALTRLNPGGCIIVGWGSNFSGRTITNWSHWPLGMIRTLRQVSQLSAPIIAEAGRTGIPRLGIRLLSWSIIRTGFALKKHVTFFMIRQIRSR